MTVSSQLIFSPLLTNTQPKKKIVIPGLEQSIGVPDHAI